MKFTQPCTPANANQVRELVHAWPLLADVVRQAQSAGVFPGLRCIRIHYPDAATRERGIPGLIDTARQRAADAGQ